MKPHAATRSAIALACTAAPGPALAQGRADTGVGFEPTRVLVTAPAVGNLGSRTLLTSVDSVGSSAVQDASVAANWELIARLPGVQLTNFNPGTTSGKPSFRGFNGEGEVNAVELLIDGVPSNCWRRAMRAGSLPATPCWPGCTRCTTARPSA